MLHSICFYLYLQQELWLYPSFDGIDTIAIDTINRVNNLKGKQQLIIKRTGENGNYAFVLYNHTLNNSKDSFGICFYSQNLYPQNVGYIFSLFGNILSNILEEGKILYFNQHGAIKYGNEKFQRYEVLLKKHLDQLVNQIDIQKLCFAPFSSNYYEIYQNQTEIFQLTDTTWTVSEALKTNNIVIVTTAIENENINKYQNVIRLLRDEKRSMANELERQKEIYSKLQKEKKNYKYVVALLVLLLISGICLFLIYESKEKEERQYAQKEKVMTDSIVSKNNAITNIQDDLSKTTMQFDSLQQAYSSLQSSYSSIENKLKDTQASKSNLENRIKDINTKIGNRQPFAVIDMAYNWNTGILSVSYYGFSTGNYTITVKALYNDTNYNCKSHNVKIEKGFHRCDFPIGKRKSKKFVLMIGKTVIGGDFN